MSPKPAPEREPAAAARRPDWRVDLAIMLGAFALVSVVAELAGAPNLGTALSFGQIAFALAAVYVLLRR